MDVTAAKAAQNEWEKANGITLMTADEIYSFDAEKYKESLAPEPWKKEYDPRIARLCPIFDIRTAVSIAHPILSCTPALITSRRSESQQLRC